MKKILFALLPCFFAATVFAQQKTAVIENSLLWRISGKGLVSPSYLFGTHHLLCPSDYLWTDSMEACFARAKGLCLEMNVDDTKEVMKVSGAFMDTTGKKIQDYFKPEDYAVVEKYFKDTMGVSLDMFGQFKPVLLLQLLEVNSVKCSDAKTYELVLAGEAKKNNQHISGLENAEESINILMQIPVDSIVKDVLELVHGDTKSDAVQKDLLTAYKNQDLKAMYKLIQEIDPYLLSDRNKNWIPRIQAKMKKESTFFAVGAGHLYGDEGVITLLRKAGYRVEAVRQGS